MQGTLLLQSLLITTEEELYKSYGITPNLVAQSGHPDTAVKSYIAENDIDMLVMGADGKKSVCEFFVGSVTQHLIQETTIPLFLYH